MVVLYLLVRYVVYVFFIFFWKGWICFLICCLEYGCFFEIFESCIWGFIVGGRNRREVGKYVFKFVEVLFVLLDVVFGRLGFGVV